MHCQVPDNARVLLEQAQVHSDGVVVIDFADVCREFAHLSYGTSVQKGVIYCQHQAASVGLVDKPLRVFNRRRDRFFHQDVLAGLQRPHGELEVARHRGGDSYCIDLGIIEQILEIFSNLDGWEPLPQAGQAFRL
jgi:hypothetical protein